MSGHEARGEAVWGRGTTVSVSRLPGPDQPMARAIGIGELAGRLEVGRPIQLRLDAGAGGRILAATTIVRIESIGPDTLRIATRNHRYELRRVAASVTGRAAADAPRGEACDERDDASAGDRTQVVSVMDWPEPAPGRFETGARIRLSQERSGESRELGPAILMADLVAGEPASFSLDGRVVSTSPVTDVADRGQGRIRIATANSVYLIELDDRADEASHG